MGVSSLVVDASRVVSLEGEIAVIGSMTGETDCFLIGSATINRAGRQRHQAAPVASIQGPVSHLRTENDAADFRGTLRKRRCGGLDIDLLSARRYLHLHVEGADLTHN